MLIYHQAHSEFLLETASGYRILTDPFDAHVGYPMQNVQCDAVTVSHGHGDHSYIAKAQGVQTILDKPGRFTPAPGVTVYGIPSYHDDRQGALRGGNIIFILETDDLRIAHFGDLGAWDDALLRQLQGIDIALLPVGGHFTISAGQAARLIAALRPRMVIPMHYSTQANADWPIQPLDECLQALGCPGAPKMPLLRVTREDLSEQPACVILNDRVNG